MKPAKRLFILDTLALIYRAHFALHQYTRTNGAGLEVGALWGFCNTLVEVLQKQQPSHVIAAYDSPAPTWRKKVYPLYKAQRQVQPEAITTAIPYSKTLLEAFQIPHVEQAGYEADDLIGTLAKQAAQEDFDVYIVSGDKDLDQLVAEHISLYRPARGGKVATIWRKPAILAHWGVETATQIPDILGLWGDSSDNIPGVPKVGPKTAQKLLAQYGSIEAMIAQLPTLKEPWQTRIRTHEKVALLSKKLATISTDVPMEVDLATCVYQEPKADLLKPLLAQLSFRSLSKRLFPETTAQLGLFPSEKRAETTEEVPSFSSYDPKQVNYAVSPPKALSSLVKAIMKQPAFCFSIVTTGLNPHMTQLLGLSLAYRPGQAHYIPLPADGVAAETVLKTLQPLFNHSTCLKVGQGLKYNLLVLQRHGVAVSGPFFDTMIAHHLLVPAAQHHLVALAERYLGYTPIELVSLIGKGKQQRSVATVPESKLLPYSCEKTDLILQLYELFVPQLQEEKVAPLFYEVEMKLLPVLAKMEQAGIGLDMALLQQASLTLGTELEQLGQQIHLLAGESFNIASPKQLGQVLFEKLKLVEKPAKTTKGQFSTNEIILQGLAKKHPIIAKVLSYRTLKKLKSTYVDALPALLGADKRLHTSFQQGFVSTGRLSSVNPNLQNIPIRTERGRAIRKAFVAQPGHLLVAADYSQVELRVIAHFSQDKAMLAAFQADKDVHTMTAKRLYHVETKAVTPAMRRKAKMVNFGLIYGISPFGLSQRLSISRSEAAEIIKAYFVAFPGIKTYMEDTVEQTKKQGYISTLLGRKRFLPDILSKNSVMRNFAVRNAINMPIQGTAAELIQRAMIDIDAWLTKRRLRARMILQVHDELIFEVHERAVEEVTQTVPELMARALPLSLPITVTVGVGKDWLTAHGG